ncbi:MAG: hypothetical protein QHJ34_09840 [bacterium]|nr:hypothetical protein [candidate division KSB1 bacterium]MDH7560519.1 hypothetical protein [bacterium]
MRQPTGAGSHGCHHGQERRHAPGYNGLLDGLGQSVAAAFHNQYDRGDQRGEGASNLDY